MTTGQQAEQAVAAYLTAKEYQIIDKNWRTKLAEIDLVAKKQNKVYFVEVKYRSNADFGAGLEYITPKKLSRMKFASELWVSANNWQNNYQLLVASVAGPNFEDIDIIELEV